MIWRWLRQFPKFLVALVIIAAALAIGVIWKLQKAAREAAARVRPAQVEDTNAKQSLIAAKHDRLILVDNDLYDIDNGAVVFKAWLKQGMPLRLFWQDAARKMLAQYERGFIRYNLDGSVDAELPNLPASSVSDDFKWAVFSRSGDVHRADIDWSGMKLTNERKLTSFGQFNDRFFAANLFLGTERTLIVRHMNKVVQVNQEAGTVKPMDFSLLDLAKRKSPDSHLVVGLEGGKFYCYEVDTDQADYHPVSRAAINDYEWLGNGKCAVIIAMRTVMLYDRQKKTFNEVASLPFPCIKIGETSGRFVFCAGRGMGALVDVEKKTVTSVAGGTGITWVSNDTFAFAREMQDSDLRGTWLQTIGESERRVSPEPYLVNNRGDGFIMALPKSGLMVFATKQALSKMKADGSAVVDIVKLTHAPARVLEIENWKR